MAEMSAEELEYFKERMSPEIFEAYVKGMGIVKGVENLPDRSFEEYENG